MKLPKETKDDLIDFVTQLATNPYGFAEYLDQTVKLQGGWTCHIIIKQEEHDSKN